MPIITFTYQLKTFKIVGTRRAGETWEHSVKCIETGQYKWKSDEWVNHAHAPQAQRDS